MTDTTKTASIDALGELHELVARQLKAKLESGEATAADFTAAINFLRANDIKARPVEGSALDKLGKAIEGKGVTLPFEGTPHSLN